MTRALRQASHVPEDLPDLARFVTEVTARVNAGAWARDASARNDEGPVVVARAPGRLDVMGGIADYSGALGTAVAHSRGHARGPPALERAAIGDRLDRS